MAKNIVFCADGTWNGLGTGDAQDLQPDATNVLRLFSSLAGTVTPETVRMQDEQEKLELAIDGKPRQIAKYLHGVGDSQNAIRKMLGGVFGEGFIERIVRGYTFLSRNYQPGDRIHLVGFSRGAYTARALGGMVTRMGLLPPAQLLAADGSYDADTAYKYGIHVWAQYRRALGKQSTLLGYLEEFKGQKIDLQTLVPHIPIEAIAVWDTVGSLGVPLYGLADASKVDIFEFADLDLSPQVKAGFHALAIDEQREDFQPTLWNDRSGIEQRWFCGAHADVGGGYAKEDLSMCTLDWMIGRLQASGVDFSAGYQAMAKYVFGPIHTPYMDPPFDALPHGPRRIPAGALFHPSVQVYLQQFPAYQPEALVALLSDRELDHSVLMA